MKATQLLKNEHEQILRALTVLEEMAARTSRGETINRKDATDMVHILEGFADRHHQGKEEAILFPALLQDHTQQHYAALCRLIFEHNRERFLVRGLEEAIESGKARDFEYCANSLVSNLRNHITNEEQDLFALTDSVLSPDEDECLAAEMQQFEKAWQRHVMPWLQSRLEELERNYHPQRSAA